MKGKNPSLAFFRYKRSIKALEMVDFIAYSRISDF